VGGKGDGRVEDVVELDRFLPESYADILEELICRSGQFLWQHNASTNNQAAPEIMNRDARSYEADQFVHALYQEGERRSAFFDIVFPMFYFMEDKTGVAVATPERMKANLLVQRHIEDGTYNTPHIDIGERGYKSLLYYVKDSDGDTYLFNETFADRKGGLTLRKRVSPRKGKAVLFDSNIWHASSHPRANATRVVLNFVFRVK
jgi:hypothetical protein